MKIIDVRKKSPFAIDSTLLVPDELFPSQEIEGGYLETYAITPIILIEKIKRVKNLLNNLSELYKRLYSQ